MKFFYSLIAIFIGITSATYAQKIFSEGTLNYNISMVSENKEAKSNAMDGATTTVYIKNGLSRIDMVTTLGTESTVHDAKSGSSFILKAYSGQKLMITLNKDDWEDKNKAFANMNFNITSDMKTIAGYNCKKAVGQTSTGTTFTVYYTPDLIPANKDGAFKNLPGLALDFEVDTGKMKFKYTLEKISFDPVLSSKFDAPKVGYRVMTYEENKKLTKGN